MIRWKQFKIAELGRIITGRTPPTSRPECFEGGYPFITPSDMDGRRVISSTDRTLSEEGAQLLKRIMLPPHSVAVSCIGWQLGKVVLTDRPSFTNQQINSIIVNKNHNHLFVYYALSIKRETLKNIGSMGVRTPIVNKSAFSSIELEVPQLAIQNRIASILSSYDDFIENNTRRIEILEEMVRRLYEEWFVHFRFPGHEEVSFKESELGEIPEGWEVVTVGDLVNIKRGKTITKKKIEPGNVPVVAGGLRPAYYHSTANTKAPLLTISASGANAGHVSLYYDDVWASDSSFIDSSQSQHVYYYYLMLKVRQEDVTHLQRGSAQPHVYPKDVMGLQAVNAPLSLRESFMNYVGPMFRAIDTLLKKNVNLRAQRDLLLPKLVSGEIDVSDIPMPDDKEAEAA